MYLVTGKTEAGPGASGDRPGWSWREIGHQSGRRRSEDEHWVDITAAKRLLSPLLYSSRFPTGEVWWTPSYFLMR